MDKKTNVLNSQKNTTNKFRFLVPLVIIIVALSSWLLLKANKEEISFGNSGISHQKVKARSGKITLPVNQFNDGQAKYFKYKFPEKTIYFFVVKSSDGIIRAAFDACDVCYRAQKGYRQQNEVMVCNNCGQTFPTNRINIEKGGCNPAPIERTIVDSKVVINVQDLYSGLKYF
ncbi:Fe-S-containing protein [Candidatus Margulisiibacteriota bacterium]